MPNTLVFSGGPAVLNRTSGAHIVIFNPSSLLDLVAHFARFRSYVLFPTIRPPDSPFLAGKLK